MSRRKSVPSYLFHKPTGQARVRINGRDVYLGKFDSPESMAEYQRIVGELAAAATPEAVARVGPATPDISVNEVLVAFWDHAQKHYRHPDGTPTSEVAEFRLVARGVRELYGHTPAREFGPLALKAIRQAWVAAGLSRAYVNGRVRRVRQIFKWAAGEELVPAAVLHGLQAVGELQKGRTPAPEPEPVRPVNGYAVDATIPFVLPAVAGMIELQRLTGMRPQDVCGVCPCDLDVSGAVWAFRPPQHKTAHRGAVRVVPIGPRGQEVLRKFWPADPADYFFSPARAVAEMHAARTAARVTPGAPQFRFRVKKPKKKPAAKYTTSSYDKAIRRGADKATATAAKHDVPEGQHGPNLPRVPHWAPNQLRHAFGTDVRKRFGLEAAQVLLGHARADVTQVYAERDLALGERVAAEVG